MNLIEAAAALERFGGSDLTLRLAEVESQLRGLNAADCRNAIPATGANDVALNAAGLLKHVAGQINVVIHALGILLCLPHLLREGERIEYVSLGAGNTGRPFDLETSERVAEFKFINWRGGPESIRQNSLFKDFYMLAENPSSKQKFLYVLGVEHPLKFFNGGRALSSVLSRNEKIKKLFDARYGASLKTVREYFAIRRNVVTIQDVSIYLGALLSMDEDAEDPSDEGR
ncbi:MAG: hypothetical protein HY243_12130 [Proteobacteria bacterium]|nr:hypothetical protein [Pseudomonadota bacterium]